MEDPVSRRVKFEPGEAFGDDPVYHVEGGGVVGHGLLQDFLLPVPLDIDVAPVGSQSLAVEINHRFDFPAGDLFYGNLDGRASTVEADDMFRRHCNS